MIPRPSLTRLGLRSLAVPRNGLLFRRSITAAPKEGSGPLMERRSDRALPSIANSRRWLRTIPVFVVIMTLSTLAIFNYQKTNSSVVSSTLYALRTNPRAREILGDEIYFAHKVPWISGELNQLHGRIDLGFWVKGTKGVAFMKFKSERKYRMGYFETLDWSLETSDGTVHRLLESESVDPFINSNIVNVNEANTAPAS